MAAGPEAKTAAPETEGAAEADEAGADATEAAGSLLGALADAGADEEDARSAGEATRLFLLTLGLFFSEGVKQPVPSAH